MLIAALVVASLVAAPQAAAQQAEGSEDPPRSLELGPQLPPAELPPAELPAAELPAEGPEPPSATGVDEGSEPGGAAAGETQAPALDGPWARLGERGVASGNLRFGGWLRTSVLYTDRAGADALGTELDDLRLLVSSSFEGIDLVLASEASDSRPELTHAYAFGRFDERHEWIVGRFRVPFLHGSVVDEDRLLFTERTLIGEAFDIDELGLGLRGSYPFASFSAALQNAEDQARDALRGTVRTSFHLPGQAQPRTERIAGDAGRPITALTLAYTDDATLPTGDAYALGLDVARRGKRLTAEWIDLGDSLGGGQPWTLTGAFAVDQHGLELGVRYQNLDDLASTRRFGLVVARSLYADLVRWQGSLERTNSDDPALDGLSLRMAIVLSL